MRTVLLFGSLLFTLVLWAQTETPNPKEEKSNFIYNNAEPELKEVEKEKSSKDIEGKKDEIKGRNAVLKKSKSKSVAPAPVSNQQKIKISQQLYQEYDDVREQSQSPRSRTISLENQKNLNKIVDKMESNNSMSFEFNLAKYVNGNHDLANFQYLEKAYKQQSSNQEVVQLMIAYYEISSNKSKRKEFSKKLKDLNVFSKETYAYVKNVLNSVPVNGILVTHGSLDTYPLYVLMDVEGVRTDVRVVSLDFLQSETYRNKITNAGVLLPSNHSAINTNYLREFCDLNKFKALYLSFTIPKNYFEGIKSNLYASGLVFQYSVKKLNNMEAVIISWNKFDKGIFEKQTQPNNESKELISNYLVPLILLKKYYQKENNFGKAEEMGAYISKLAEWKSKEKTVEKILSN